MIPCAEMGCSNEATGRCRTCKNVFCVAHYQSRGGVPVPPYILCDKCNRKQAPIRVAIFVPLVLVSAWGGWYVGGLFAALFGLTDTMAWMLSIGTSTVMFFMVAAGSANA